MAVLTKAHQDLFRRVQDECFDSLDDLCRHCERQRAASTDLWERPQEVQLNHDLTIRAGGDGAELRLNDWSFSQFCGMAGVAKGTVIRLSCGTASQVLAETLPRSDKPLQILATDDRIRSVHGVSYTRLWNAELLGVVQEFASDFSPPQVAADGIRTGLYCGEQDMFAFLIDPTGWAEINGEAFAPGFFIWNSEVGRRSVGIQSFWFQRICQNHIVWDATEIVEFSRKHTANVHDGLLEIRRIVESLVARRNERRDSFAAVMGRAMTERLGDTAEDVSKTLSGKNIPRQLIKDAMEIAYRQGGFTIFSVVDALTKLSQRTNFAGDRAELDVRIGRLLALAA